MRKLLPLQHRSVDQSLSLRWQLSITYAILVLIVVALLTGIATHAAATIALSSQKQRAQTAVVGVASAFADSLATPNSDMAQIARQQSMAIGGRVLWLNADGSVRVDGLGEVQHIDPELHLPQNLAGGKTATAEIYQAGNTWLSFAVAPVIFANQSAGQVLLIQDLASIQQQLSQLRRTLWLLGLVLALFFALVGLYWAKSLTQPLERLSEAVIKMRDGQLNQSVIPGGNQEMKHLALAFNDMAHQVATLDDQRRSFIANAAHELRTPLASLHALAEGMQVSCEVNQDDLAGLVRQTERLSRLVDNLLVLARLDNPQLQLHHIPVRVSNLLHEALWTIKPLVVSKSLELKMVEISDQPWVNGDPDWLHHALVNLLDNAVRHTPPHGWIALRTSTDTGMVHISIEDSGQGVTAEALGQFGTRFCRLSKARERDTGGSGLGLAIVREVAHIHHGQVSFTCPPGKGLTVTLSLPGVHSGES